MNPVWHFLNGVPNISAPVVLGPVSISASAVTSTVPYLGPDGTSSAPTFSFASQPGKGFYLPGSANIAITDGASRIFDWGTTSLAFSLYTTGTLGWGSGAAGAGNDVVLSRAAADVLTTPDRFVSTGPTAGIGYATGAGGTQTQLTSKATTVVLNTITGEITMHNATLNAATAVTFALTNSAIATGDMVLVQHISAGSLGAYVCQGIAGSGTANITVTNRSAGNLGEAIVLKFLVLKAATS